MPDTTTRPTAWAVLYDELDPVSTSDLDRALDKLAEHDYVIVHPDDVPEDPPGDEPGVIHDGPDEFKAALSRTSGWNACRAYIFGDTK